jgi:hypothetical protein
VKPPGSTGICRKLEGSFEIVLTVVSVPSTGVTRVKRTGWFSLTFVK